MFVAGQRGGGLFCPGLGMSVCMHIKSGELQFATHRIFCFLVLPARIERTAYRLGGDKIKFHAPS